MDLETENRIATILLKEAAELRRQAENEGALAYLHRPNVRGRPNSRFLTATVLGVQQGKGRTTRSMKEGIQSTTAHTNRAVEVNEMWNVRQKELELENRLKRRSADENRSSKSCSFRTSRSSSLKRDVDSVPGGSENREIQDFDSREEKGLKDTEVEEFLQSRVKRGRGSVGSRMDETGPYLPSCPDSGGRELASPGMGLREGFGNHVVIGPEKPMWLNSHGSSEDESSSDDKTKVSKKAKSSRHHHCRKHKSKKKSRDKKDKQRREEKREKHHK